MTNHINAYINSSWEHPHLYSASEHSHGIQMGEDYVLRLHHWLRPAAVSVTPDGVYCGECGAEVTRAWREAQRGAVDDEPVDVDRLLQERDALQAQVNELQEQLQYTTGEDAPDDAPTDPHRLARRAEGAEYALRSLQLRVADMAQDIERHITSAHPYYIAQRLRSMLPPTIGGAWGLAGWWATDRTLGDVYVVDAEPDDDGEVEVRYMDTGRPVQGYAHAGALTNWRTTR